MPRCETATSVPPVSAILDQIRSTSKTEHEKGTRFELLTLHALKADRTYAAQFSEVWMWADAPNNDGHDIGIDLVARNIDGTLTAIQCKCYAPDATLDKKDIDSFLATSASDQYSRRIIVATTDKWSQNAEKTLGQQSVAVERIGVDDLDAMTVDWSSYDIDNPAGLKAAGRHRLRTHQQAALGDVIEGFKQADRGKLIMACGTGKTFTALRIAERQAGAGGSVLFLAPSIALVAQSLKEWTGECELPIRPYAVCSDPTAGKPLPEENATPFDLAIPATTDTAALIDAGLGKDASDDGAMTVVFSTYQSIEVVAAAQQETGLTFDLIVCDEAHRTAGVAEHEGDSTAFSLVHDNERVPAKKRLYMTATPRLFKPAAKEDAAEKDAILASMDDPAFFGEELHRLGFGDAVSQGLLADYRVLILAVDERSISESFQDLLSRHGELSLPDVARFVGCLSALAKLPGQGGSSFAAGEQPMRRAVAFWSRINESERFAEQFDEVADRYFDHLASQDDNAPRLSVPTRHVDGTAKISSRRADIRWLKEQPADDECRVLTNAQCLTEGVDVPALDAVMFLTPRRSKIDIVQAVGRVMRKPPGKELGYVILPIAISAGQDPQAALDQNKDYDAVWEVLQALRAHDERFNAYINRIALGSTKPGSGPDDPIKVFAVDAAAGADGDAPRQGQLFAYEEWTDAIYTKIVAKVGTRTYWEDWAKDIAKIAAAHETRIRAILAADGQAAAAFSEFVAELHATLNDAIDQDDAIAMVSQHLITRPIFEALFGDDEFGRVNPVAQAMGAIAEKLDEHELESEIETLDAFYSSVRRRVEGIHPDDGAARQTIIKDLYGRFFKIAFPKVAASLGIVYTPLEVVDFIIRATEGALHEHFVASLSDEGVHVLDPFTGTGTFITRVLQSGFITSDDLGRKFEAELHANELLLLAYYIAAVNIESTYRQERARLDDRDPGHTPFPGIVLTDTFQLGESGEGSGRWDVFPVNNDRAERQRKLDIRVIFGNPPWSSGQESANDNNANLNYPLLDKSIEQTYAARSTATNKNSLYDSYVRAIRWASDRVANSPDGGVISFVTNGGYIDSNTADGLRLCLAEEFDHLYVFNLRGNQRTAGEQSRREGGKIFEAGSRATVAIMVLVRLPGTGTRRSGQIHYRDIGDYKSRAEKLTEIDAALPVDDDGPPQLADVGWQQITPNKKGDWINQRSEVFAGMLPLWSESEPSAFGLRTRGLETGRDAWNYNSSEHALNHHIRSMISHYNDQVTRFEKRYPRQSETTATSTDRVKTTVDLNPTKFSWSRINYRHAASGTRYDGSDSETREALYRPFHKRWVEAGRRLNNVVSQLPRVFPNAAAENLVIAVSTRGARADFSALASRNLPDVHLWVDDTPCFPQYVYPEAPAPASPQTSFADAVTDGAPERQHNVTDHALALFTALDPAVTKDDIFFYVYGVLHSPQYRSTFAADLKKSLPRIPQVDSTESFWVFSKAGRELSRLHTEYEQLDPWPDLTYSYAEGFRADAPGAFRVTKMRHPKVADPDNPKGRKVDDRTRIIYNEQITISGIPLDAYRYELGSRTAIGWVMESWQIKIDRKSGIRNDPNDWASEHDSPRYILDLVGQVVTVSMKTLAIVEDLPPLAL